MFDNNTVEARLRARAYLLAPTLTSAGFTSSGESDEHQSVQSLASHTY